MDSERQENEAGELCSQIGNRKGIRVTSLAPRRRLRRKVTTKCCNCIVQYPSLVDRFVAFVHNKPLVYVLIKCLLKVLISAFDHKLIFL